MKDDFGSFAEFGDGKKNHSKKIYEMGVNGEYEATPARFGNLGRYPMFWNSFLHFFIL